MIAIGAVAACLALLTGCHLDMWRQNKVKALTESDFFPDAVSSRPLVAHTVARGHLQEDEVFYTGISNGKLTNAFPFPITKEDMKRGQERFNIFCTPCHGRLGDGKGMIAQRGLKLRKEPASYHTERLRKMPIGHFFDVITNGHGVMFSYATRVEPVDRWRIAAYIRALQRSHNGTRADLPGGQMPVPTESGGEAGGGEHSGGEH